MARSENLAIRLHYSFRCPFPHCPLPALRFDLDPSYSFSDTPTSYTLPSQPSTSTSQSPSLLSPSVSSHLLTSHEAMCLSQTTLDWQCPQPWSLLRLLQDLCTLISSDVTLPRLLPHALLSSYNSVLMLARTGVPPHLCSQIPFLLELPNAQPYPLLLSCTLPHSA